MKAKPMRHVSSCSVLASLKAASALAAAALLTAISPAAIAAPVDVDVTGAQSVDLLGDAGNTVWFVNVGANAVLNTLSWSVTLEAFSPSVLSEMQLSFGGSSGLDLVSFAPADGDFNSGVGSYAGSLDLSGLGLGVGADGLLRLEFSEAFKDLAPGVADGRWLSGTLSFDVTQVSPVPEPASLALVMAGLALMGGLGTAGRRGTGGRAEPSPQPSPAPRARGQEPDAR